MPRATRQARLRAWLTVAVAFFLVFSGFYTCQNFLSKLLDRPGWPIGSVSLALINVALAAAAPSMPRVVRRWGPARALSVAGFGFVAFVGAAVYVVTPLLLLAAVVEGVCAAMLWTAQGAMLCALSSPQSRGRFAGIFNMFAQGSYVAGSLLAHWLVRPGEAGAAGSVLVPGAPAEGPFFPVLAGVCLAGALLLTCARVPPPPEEEEQPAAVEAAEEEEQTSVGAFLAARDSRLLLPVLLLAGLSMSFCASMFSREMDASDIGAAMTVLGLAEIAGSRAAGHAYDALGTRAGALGAGAVYALGLALMWRRRFLPAAAALGVADSSVLALGYTALAQAFSGDSEVVFSAFILLQSVGAALGFLLAAVIAPGRVGLEAGLMGGCVAVSVWAFRRWAGRGAEYATLST